MSWLYWPPRSTTNTGRSSGRASGVGSGTTFATSAPVVRGVLRDGDAVRMALLEAGRRDAGEARRRLHLLDRGRAAVAHRLAETADDLVDDRRERPFVRNAALDPLRDELVDVLDVALEVAILRERARLHRAERAHPAVLLEALALRDDDLPGRLVGAREHRPEHDDVRAG